MSPSRREGEKGRGAEEESRRGGEEKRGRGDRDWAGARFKLSNCDVPSALSPPPPHRLLYIYSLYSTHPQPHTLQLKGQMELCASTARAVCVCVCVYLCACRRQKEEGVDDEKRRGEKRQIAVINSNVAMTGNKYIRRGREAK